MLWINAASIERAVDSYSQCAATIHTRHPSITASTGTAADIKWVQQWLNDANKQKSWLMILEFRDCSLQSVEGIGSQDMVA